MLIVGIVVFCLGSWYILSQAPTAEVVANRLEAGTEVLIRGLRAHAAGKRAAERAYRTERDLRWNRPHARRLELEFWSGVAEGMREAAGGNNG